MCVIVKNMRFLGTNILYFRERIYLLTERYFQRIWQITLFFFILVRNIYNPTLNNKAVICMKLYTIY